MGGVFFVCLGRGVVASQTEKKRNKRTEKRDVFHSYLVSSPGILDRKHVFSLLIKVRKSLRRGGGRGEGGDRQTQTDRQTDRQTEEKGEDGGRGDENAARNRQTDTEGD